MVALSGSWLCYLSNSHVTRQQWLLIQQQFSGPGFGLCTSSVWQTRGLPTFCGKAHAGTYAVPQSTRCMPPPLIASGICFPVHRRGLSLSSPDSSGNCGSPLCREPACFNERIVRAIAGYTTSVRDAFLCSTPRIFLLWENATAVLKVIVQNTSFGGTKAKYQSPCGRLSQSTWNIHWRQNCHVRRQQRAKAFDT
ncbi:hypothetical protein BKA81DRAFT_207066 [Phyllosticta paracitricarpa]